MPQKRDSSNPCGFSPFVASSEAVLDSTGKHPYSGVTNEKTLYE
jgi:hypothetical protein